MPRLALQERTTELEYRTTQLSQMAWDLTLAEHHAREQIARTLHDGLQQLLVIVALNLEHAAEAGERGRSCRRASCLQRRSSTSTKRWPPRDR